MFKIINGVQLKFAQKFTLQLSGPINPINMAACTFTEQPLAELKATHLGPKKLNPYKNDVWFNSLGPQDRNRIGVVYPQLYGEVGILALSQHGPDVDGREVPPIVPPGYPIFDAGQFRPDFERNSWVRELQIKTAAGCEPASLALEQHEYYDDWR